MLLQPILNDLNSIIDNSLQLDGAYELTNDIYSRIVTCLDDSAPKSVTCVRKRVFKYWWTKDYFKSKSIDTGRLCKEVGRPRSGDIFNQRNKARPHYRHAIRKSQRSVDQVYTNDLHKALKNKRGQDFRKCWNPRSILSLVYTCRSTIL